jgi:hypothetical protein
MASYLDEFLNKPRNPQASGDIFSGLYNPEQIADLESQYTNEYGIKNTSGGIASDARHMAAMNNLSNSLSPMNNGIGNFIGDTGAFLAGGLNEIGALGRGFNKENFAEIGEDIAANFRGSFGTPNSTTAEDIYSQVFTGAVPQRVASSNNQAYGAAQASELTDLERDFPGMSTGDIIDSMNNRAFIGRQISPMAKPQIASPRTVIDPNRIPGRIQESVEPRQGILQGLQDKMGGLRDFLPFGDKSLSGMAVKGLKSLFERDPNAPSYQTYDPTGKIDYSQLNTTNLNDFYDSNEDSETFGTTRFDRAAPGSFGSFRTLADYFNRNKNAAAALTTKKAKKEAAMQQQIKDAQAAQAQQRAREAATATRAMAANPDVYRNAGITSGGFASQNTGSNPSFSNKTGRGRTGYQEGGLASMFTRRR